MINWIRENIQNVGQGNRVGKPINKSIIQLNKWLKWEKREGNITLHFIHSENNKKKILKFIKKDKTKGNLRHTNTTKVIDKYYSIYLVCEG